MNIFFIGIAGAGMASLAKYMMESGEHVYGSDPFASQIAKELWRARGCTVYDSHSADNIKDADRVVYSAAIPANNPERKTAELRNIGMSRGQALALVANQHGGCIAVCGTHGKGTTAGAIVHILIQAGLNPGYILGAQPISLPSPSHFEPNAKYLVCEVDESDRTNLYHQPKILLINNIEADHLNTYGSLENIVDCFVKHIEQCIHGNSRVILHYAGVGAEYLWKSIQSSSLRNHNHIIWIAPETGPAEAQWHYKIHSVDEIGCHTMKLWNNNIQEHKHSILIKCHLPGYANAQNLISAAVTALSENISEDDIIRAAATYDGLKDRCEIQYAGNCSLVTDYASHPTCVSNDISWNAMQAERIVAIYHPYRYSLMQYHWDALSDSLSRANVVIIPPMDGAGETPVNNIDSEHLALKIREHNMDCDARAYDTFEEAEKAACSLLKDGDRIIVFGGGSLFDMGRRILSSRNNHE